MFICFFTPVKTFVIPKENSEIYLTETVLILKTVENVCINMRSKKANVDQTYDIL